jgi:hypothetical protein
MVMLEPQSRQPQKAAHRTAIYALSFMADRSELALQRGGVLTQPRGRESNEPCLARSTRPSTARGPHEAADAVVFNHCREILLIKRSYNGLCALDTARRERLRKPASTYLALSPINRKCLERSTRPARLDQDHCVLFPGRSGNVAKGW